MSGNDPTTPLAALPAADVPTDYRGAAPSPQRSGGFSPGTLIADRYRITSLLGSGGMGEVYRADDLRLGQPVALKFINAAGDRVSNEHLYHEVRVARQVTHPNVCRVHDVVESNGLRFIAMEYVDGEDLASLLHRIGRLPAPKAIDIARDVAAGLAAAHDRGIVHRDLKPANVMIDGNGRARVTDFGLASIAGTHDGLIAGTPAYMAPEQVAGEPATPRTDVYAFGLLLHELFTGERVHAARSFADRKRLPASRPKPVSSLVKDADPAIDALVADCLAEDPAARPASAHSLLKRLPGGDAIDAALAAGETPSPEMVAAAAESGELSLSVIAATLTLIVAGVLLAAWQVESFVFSLMRKPPEVMLERAAEIRTLAGETKEPRDSAHWFSYDSQLRRSPAGKVALSQLATVRPGAMRFIVRTAQERMAPRGSEQAGNSIFIFQSGRITSDDPPLNRPGSAMITLDQNRALVEYRASPSTTAIAAEWKPLLEATGIDLTTLTPVTPRARPPVASDSRAAWTAGYPGRSERVTIEAASLQGRPAWLRVAGPWGSDDEARTFLPTSPVVGIVQLIMMIGFSIPAIIFAVRNLRRGRADRSGALRLAFYIGGSLFAAWLVAAHHAADPESEARLLAFGLGEAVDSAVIVWVFYIALEPGVRRTWPRSLIGWTRLSAGRLRDAMVGREILFGIATGVVSVQILIGAVTVAHWIKRSMASAYVHASGLDPLGIFAGDQLVGHVASIEIAIGSIFILLLLCKAVGRIGGYVAFGLMAATYVVVSPGISIYLLLLMFVLLRFGVLTAAVTGAVQNLLFTSPLTLDTGAWYWPRALTVMLIVVAAAAWAARTAMARRI